MKDTQKQKRPPPKYRIGFTLIEILVVMGILGIIVSLVIGMFFWVLKGSAKSQAIAEIRQNGNYALNVMERMIRSAQSLDDYSGSSLTITNPDGGVTVFSCGDSNGNSISDIASTSADLNTSVPLIGDGVEVQNCNSFFQVVSPTGGGPETVEINFTLSQANSPVKIEDRASAVFQTTVVLRNF